MKTVIFFSVLFVILFALMLTPGIIMWRRKEAYEEKYTLLGMTYRTDEAMKWFNAYKPSFYIIKRLGLRNAFMCAFLFGYTIGKLGTPIFEKKEDNQANHEEGGAAR